MTASNNAHVYEFHGWATLRSTASTRDDEVQEREDVAAIKAVLKLVSGRKDLAEFTGGQISVRQVNGDTQVWLHGLRNHRQASVADLFERIAEVAPGSYGLLHIHDDEAHDPDLWECRTMLRGVVSVSTEARLTPHRGRVEDP